MRGRKAQEPRTAPTESGTQVFEHALRRVEGLLDTISDGGAFEIISSQKNSRHRGGGCVDSREALAVTDVVLRERAVIAPDTLLDGRSGDAQDYFHFFPHQPANFFRRLLHERKVRCSAGETR